MATILLGPGATLGVGLVLGLIVGLLGGFLGGVIYAKKKKQPEQPFVPASPPPTQMQGDVPPAKKK